MRRVEAAADRETDGRMEGVTDGKKEGGEGSCGLMKSFMVCDCVDIRAGPIDCNIDIINTKVSIGVRVILA